MYFDKFTKKAQKVIDISIKCAKDLGHSVVGTEHILLGLIKVEEGIASKILIRLGIESEGVSKQIVDIYGIGINDNTDDIFLSPRSRSILDKSIIFLNKSKNKLIDTEHILLALSQEEDSLAIKILKKRGIDKQLLEKSIKEYIDIDDSIELIVNQIDIEDKKKDKLKISTLEKYAINLNDNAKNNKIDPLIGREKEVQRIIQVLSRRTKNNPVVIGDPGVGKTAIIEGLAIKIEEKDVPKSLENKIIYNLDISGVLAGAKYRGEFEERIKK